MSREHVLPEWLSKLGEGDTYTVRVGTKMLPPTRLMQVVTRRVCEPCNTGWMKRIEDGAAAVMTPIVKGEPQRIGEYERFVIARWFTKTILTLHLTRSRARHDMFGPEAYANFYRTCLPWHNALVFLAGYHGSPRPIEMVVRAPSSTTEYMRAYLHFHRVLLCAIAANEGTPFDLTLPEGFDRALVPLSPPDRDLIFWGSSDPTRLDQWPPPAPFHNDEVLVFREFVLPP